MQTYPFIRKQTHALISPFKLIETLLKKKTKERSCVHEIFFWRRRELPLIFAPNILSISIAYFHPNWSKGTAAVRGNHAINSCRHYWEIHVSHRVFGTRYTHAHFLMNLKFCVNFKTVFIFLFFFYSVWCLVLERPTFACTRINS